MRRLMVPLFFGILALLPAGAQAQSDRYQEREAREQAYRDKMSALRTQVPPNISNALAELHHNNYYDQAEKEIYAGSQIPADGSLANAFRANRQHDGQYGGFDVVSVQNITPRLRVIYLALEYEMAPHFLRFTVYSTAGGWVVLHSSWVNEDIFETTPLIPAETTPTQ